MKAPESYDPDRPVFHYIREERLARTRMLTDCPRPANFAVRNRMLILTFVNILALFLLGNLYLHFFDADPNISETSDLRFEAEGRLSLGRAYLSIKVRAKLDRPVAGALVRFEVFDRQGAKLIELFDNLPIRRGEERLVRFDVPGVREKGLTIQAGSLETLHRLKIMLKE
jgi:hypothetical protein